MSKFALLDESPWLAETAEQRLYVSRRIVEKATLWRERLEREQEEAQWLRLKEDAERVEAMPKTVRPPAFCGAPETTHVRKKLT
jgi:hypothetical protein